MIQLHILPSDQNPDEIFIALDDFKLTTYSGLYSENKYTEISESFSILKTPDTDKKLNHTYKPLLTLLNIAGQDHLGEIIVQKTTATHYEVKFQEISLKHKTLALSFDILHKAKQINTGDWKKEYGGVFTTFKKGVGHIGIHLENAFAFLPYHNQRWQEETEITKTIITGYEDVWVGPNKEDYKKRPIYKTVKEKKTEDQQAWTEPIYGILVEATDNSGVQNPFFYFRNFQNEKTNLYFRGRENEIDESKAPKQVVETNKDQLNPLYEYQSWRLLAYLQMALPKGYTIDFPYELIEKHQIDKAFLVRKESAPENYELVSFAEIAFHDNYIQLMKDFCLYFGLDWHLEDKQIKITEPKEIIQTIETPHFSIGYLDPPKNYQIDLENLTIKEQKHTTEIPFQHQDKNFINPNYPTETIASPWQNSLNFLSKLIESMENQSNLENHPILNDDRPLLLLSEPLKQKWNFSPTNKHYLALSKGNDLVVLTESHQTVQHRILQKYKHRIEAQLVEVSWTSETWMNQTPDLIYLNGQKLAVDTLTQHFKNKAVHLKAKGYLSLI